jgi:4-amino-4-deoxy-L-arabinose transferase-like glycosyltransferase
MTPAISLKPAGTEQPGGASVLPTRNQFFFILFAYFSIQLVTRTLISETVGIDEADQIVLGQKWAWGYGPQPALYTWLMRLFLSAFGPSVFSLTLLRELLLFGIYALAYLNGRQLTGSHAAGIAAAVALQFNPSISWESQRELTHSIVASMMLLATVLAFLRLKPARLGAYVALGICGGLATLSKYNAALFYAALLIAGIGPPSFRARVLHWRMTMAIVISLLVLAPNLWWVATHQELAFSSMFKFGIHESTPWAEAVRTGLVQWVSKSVAHVGPTLVVFAAIFWRPIFVERALKLRSDEQKLLARTFVLIVAMAVLSVLLFKVTSFKDRWLQPVFVALPLLCVAWLEPFLDRGRLRAIVILGVLIGAVVTVAAPGRVLVTDWIDQQRSRKGAREKREVLNAPFRKFAPDLTPLVERSDFIMAHDRWLAANLHLWFPQKLALTPELVPYYPCACERCLLVWEAGQSDQAPEDLEKFSEQFSGKQIETPVFLQEVWKYHRSKQMRLGTMVVERRAPALRGPASN